MYTILTSYKELDIFTKSLTFDIKISHMQILVYYLLNE